MTILDYLCIINELDLIPKNEFKNIFEAPLKASFSISNNEYFYFSNKDNTMQVLNIYWQAWGYEQAQLRKQQYIKKSAIKLDQIIKDYHINAFSKINVFIYPTPKIRNQYLKNSICIPKNTKDFMNELEYFSNHCLRDRLPIHEHTKNINAHTKYLRIRSRVIRPFNNLPPRLSIASVIRVDAIICLF